MSIGSLVLDAALAVVGLWLTAELLLQNRAPLHWRGVALGGFALVVAGMAIRSVPVIGAGALAFATGQVFVTLAVKAGRTQAWSLRAADGALPGPLAKVPLLSAATGGQEAVAEAVVPSVGEVGPIEESADEVLPEPVVDADDEFGVYETAGYPEQQHQQHQSQPGQQGYQPYGDQQQWQQQPAPGYEQGGYPQQQEYGYYQQSQQQPYQDPYWQQQHQQQPYDPAQYQPEYGIPQQPQTYEYYQQPETWHQQQ